MDQLLKSTPAQLDCTDMRVRPFIQESRPIVKLKLLSQPPGSKLVGLWRRLAPHGHKFPHTGVEGGEVLVRNGEGVGVVWRRRGGLYRQLRVWREGPPCGFLAPCAGRVYYRCASKQPGGGGHWTGAM